MKLVFFHSLKIYCLIAPLFCNVLSCFKQMAEDLDLIDKIKAVFASRKTKYQAKVLLSERDDKFQEVLICEKDEHESGSSGECVPIQFVDHPM